MFCTFFKSGPDADIYQVDAKIIEDFKSPERTVFYRVLFHYFDEFVAEYENRFEREYGYFRSVIQEVIAGHHEAWKAVVISNFLTKGMRLLRHSVPRNKPRLWQSDVQLCPHPMPGLWGRASSHVFLKDLWFLSFLP